MKKYKKGDEYTNIINKQLFKKYLINFIKF